MKSLQATCLSFCRTKINGLYSFYIPDYGIQFRSRKKGNKVTLEFEAFFSLLECVNRNLKKEFIHKIHVYSSQPEFIFSFAKNNSYLKPGSYYRKLLEKYNRTFEISVGYIDPSNNKAANPVSQYPSVPHDRKLDIEMSKEQLKTFDFKPFGFDHEI